MWCLASNKNCKTPIPSWKNVSNHLIESNPNIKMARMDVEDHSDITKEVGVNRLPYIRFYPQGAKNNETAINFEGANTDEGYEKWILEMQE